MRQLLAEMSPRLGVRQVPRLRAETPACTKRFGEGRHFGVQARALPVGIHKPARSRTAGMSCSHPIGII